MSDQDPDRTIHETNLPSEKNDSDGSLSLWLQSANAIPSPFGRTLCLGSQVIVGMRYQGGAEELVNELVPGEQITLLREPENRFDHR